MGEDKLAEKYLLEANNTSKGNLELERIDAMSKSLLGVIYVEKGLIKEAKEMCASAWKFGRSRNDEHVEKMANICLEDIKLRKV